jgi:hypothetical protein
MPRFRRCPSVKILASLTTVLLFSVREEQEQDEKDEVPCILSLEDNNILSGARSLIHIVESTSSSILSILSILTTILDLSPSLLLSLLLLSSPSPSHLTSSPID